jgi:hypothetical protein
MKKIIFFFYILMLAQTANAADISKLNGEWYSYKWKYGYTLKGGKGYATVVNSPNFKEGQEIVRLAALSDTSFFGENVYKDGKFYKVKVTLKSDGKLYFEGEKNAKWEMERISSQDLVKLKKSEENTLHQNENSRSKNSVAKELTFADMKPAVERTLRQKPNLYFALSKNYNHDSYARCSQLGIWIVAKQVGGSNWQKETVFLATSFIVSGDEYRRSQVAKGIPDDSFSKVFDAYGYEFKNLNQQGFDKHMAQCAAIFNAVLSDAE